MGQNLPDPVAARAPPTPPDLRTFRLAAEFPHLTERMTCGHTICRACGQTPEPVASWDSDRTCAHSRCRRRLRRDVHRAAPPAEAEERRGRGRRGDPRPLHDLPAVPARSGGRLHLPAPRRGPAPPRPGQVQDRHRRGEVDRPRQAHRDRHHPRHRGGGQRRRRDHVRRTRPRPRLRLPHPPGPRPRRLRHRLQDRRRGHRPAQPRHRADGHRVHHPRPGRPRRRPHLRLRRRRIRGRGSAGRAGGHGPLRHPLLPQRQARGHEVDPRRGIRADPPRGRRGDGQVRDPRTARPQYRRTPGDPPRLLRGPRRRPQRRLPFPHPAPSCGPPASSRTPSSPRATCR